MSERLKLPNAEFARIERVKITGYLLSIASPRGRNKAVFFLSFGFSAGRWQRFAQALRIHGATHDVVNIVETDYGTRYNVDGPLDTPDGRNPQVRTVWQVDAGSDFPRFITAHPLGR